ncbi:Gamma-tubulin complex component protein [Gracilaria domingensis]|nr:Gamma-tubulin complex component protein [Gracilaria domingensis]
MSDNSLSVVQLTKEILGAKWTLGYEVLLDITGEFREHFIQQNAECRTLLFDTVLEMRLAGRLKDAEKLDHLAKSVLGGPLLESSKSALLVLLLCARNLRKSRTETYRHVFESQEIARNTIFLSSGTKGETEKDSGLFSFPLGTEDSSRSSSFPPRSSSSTSNNTLDFEDALASTARYALELETQRWANVLDVSPISGAREPVNVRFPRSIFDSKPWSKYRSFVKKLRVLEPIVKSPVSEVMSRDERILQHVFCRCICGPEYDEIVAHPDDSYELNRLQGFLLGSDELSDETKRALLGRTDTTRQRRWAHKLLTTIRSSKDEVTELTIRSSACGALFQDILSFSRVYAPHALGRSLKAVLSFTEMFADDYYRSLLERVRDGSMVPRNKSWALLSEAESMISDMYYLGELLSKLESTDGLSCAVLNVLMKDASQSIGNSALNDLFVRVLMTYMDFVWDWFFEASCRRDSRREFFGTMIGLSARGSELLQTEDELRAKELAEASDEEEETSSGLYPSIFTHEQALFLIRAGRSRSLLQYFGLEKDALAEKPACLNSSLLGSDLNLCRSHLETYARSIDSGDNVLCELDTAQHEEATISVQLGSANGYKKLKEHHSAEVSESFSDIVNGSTNQVDGCEEQKRTGKQEVVSFEAESSIASLFQLASGDIDSGCPRFEHQDSMTQSFTWERLSEGAPVKSQNLIEIYSPPLNIVFGEFMMQPLRKIDKLVQSKVMQCFVQKLNLYDHFQNLRAHVLLGAGDFANALVGQIEGAARTSEANEKYIQRRVNAAMTFYGTSGAGGRYLRDRTLLNRCLRTALNLYSRNQNAFADLLFLDSEGHAIEDESASGSVSLWDHPVEFKYNVDFPLNIIFSDEVMSLYSKISDFFLRVLRAKLSLRSLFGLSRRNSILYNTSNGSLLSNKQLQVCLWNFSWHAEHFVSIFGGFEMDQVLGTAWCEFEASWNETSCIWDLRDAHKKFLENSVRRCLLGEKHKSVVSVMSGGFDIVVKVDKKILSFCHPDAINAPVEVDNVVDLLVSASASLKRRSIFLTDVLRRLIESRAFPHLEDLLTRLDFNYFYQGSAS